MYRVIVSVVRPDDEEHKPDHPIVELDVSINDFTTLLEAASVNLEQESRVHRTTNLLHGLLSQVAQV